MEETIAQRLRRLGVELPDAAPALASYRPWASHGDVLYVSGQLPMLSGTLAHRGKLGRDLGLEDGRAAARLCAIGILAQARAALGDLERISKVLRITGYVACDPGFTEQHLVVNGASDFLLEALGERGRHSRAAVGVASLPLDAAVEIDAVIAFA